MKPALTECDCMRCESTFLGTGEDEFCPACRKNMNRFDMPDSRAEGGK